MHRRTVPITRELLQNVPDTGLRTQERVLRDPKALGDPIRGLEADAVDV
jgi:hypothetical protein